MDVRDTMTADEITMEGDVESVVARIKARGAGRRWPRPSPEGVAIFHVHAGQERPMSGAELEEHERMWRAVDADIEALDSSPIGNKGAAAQR